MKTENLSIEELRSEILKRKITKHDSIQFEIEQLEKQEATLWDEITQISIMNKVEFLDKYHTEEL